MEKLATFEMLLDEVKSRAVDGKRLLVAIAGPPGSGKSTLAERLASGIGPSAAALPMDGFHLDNATLRQKGLLDRKGAPETFDAKGFVDTVQAGCAAARDGKLITFGISPDRPETGDGYIELAAPPQGAPVHRPPTLA